MTNRQKGMLCIVLSALSFALMNVFVRLAGDLPSPEKSLFRNLIAVMAAGFVLMKNHQNLHYPKAAWLNLILRSAFGTLGILCNFYAVDHLLLADASAIQKLVPFITIVVSVFLLKEKPTRLQVILVILAFSCSLLIIKPSFSNADLGASLVQVVGAIGAGTAYVYVRKLTLQGVDKSKIIFFFSAFSLLAFIPLTMLDFKMPTLTQLVCLIMAGIMATFGQYSVTYAYSFAPASQISICDYTQIIFSAILGFFFFGQVADWMSWLGYAALIALAFINYLAGLKKTKLSS
ncbi:DMT family transporter [Ileibacterium valens]|uniref:EamA domain-containing protein n=1 Tax=Ileibacterium valens TaxID=1862668 RepID=A0A1U7NEC9_9FIRM|nr:DMT family transporter [Ileibacterium valens]OLU36133.1 hypothetical protein BM735_13000 [Erysipelotrichaceae bacterium NYU-BL-F16]OLU37922.1 hypothetical protein BO222_09430 [Ileibacterium valens]OLU41010.1 hypothetical protein BO224_04535 [Erysipelotrichaceae bacterium NYU-BL-E8]